MKFNCAYTELVTLDKIKENPENLNNHPDEQIEYFVKILEFQGQRRPIVISKRSNLIVKGHGMFLAIKHLNWERAAVDFQDYDSNAQEKADMVADNELARLAYQKKEDIIDFIMSDEDLNELDPNLLALPDFDISHLQLDEDLDEDKEKDQIKKFVFEATFPNEMEMADAKDDLLSRGFIVKVK